VKQVPDSWGSKRIDASSGRLDRAALDCVLNDLDEYAIEQALVWQAEVGATVVAISMGPAGATDALRRALSMGCDEAIHVCDEALAGADALQTAKVLAAAVRRAGCDLVLGGIQSTDAKGGVMASMVAGLLGWPQLTGMTSLRLSGERLSGEKLTDFETLALETSLPAVVNIVEKFNEPRYPNFKGIMAAKSKPVETLTAADLGIAISTSTVVVSTAEAPPRPGGVTVVDDNGDSVAAIIEFLSSKQVLR